MCTEKWKDASKVRNADGATAQGIQMENSGTIGSTEQGEYIALETQRSTEL